MKRVYFSSYQNDASRIKGEVLDVVHPRSVSEVRNVVLKNKRIVIRGAGTGLVGGAVPQGDVVLDLSKMVKISNFNEERKSVEVEAGVILDDLQDYLSRVSNLEFPVNPSSHAIATIGGMIATNAIGNRGVKYGKTSVWVRWVEVMSADGVVERKSVMELSDYTGMEGISGIIVRACLNLLPVRERSVSLLKADSYDEVVSLVRKLKMNRNVSMIEFLGRQVSVVLGMEDSYHLIVEYENGEGKFSGEEYDKIMGIRVKIGSVLSGEGYDRVEDPKVFLDRSGKLIEWLEGRKIPVFGHIGVGIFHPSFNIEQEKFIPEMMKLVSRLGGQVSGEYGIGLLKRGFVEINDQKILRNIKKRTDPLGKFNMGKVI